MYGASSLLSSQSNLSAVLLTNRRLDLKQARGQVHLAGWKEGCKRGIIASSQSHLSAVSLTNRRHDLKQARGQAHLASCKEGCTGHRRKQPEPSLGCLIN
jgi:hypothetical protein